MSFSLFPKEYVRSVYNLNFKKYYSKGFRTILFDIDNTLVPHDAPADDRAKRLFSDLRKIGFKTYIISNNKEPRVKSFCQSVGGDGYIYRAHKPSPKGYNEAMQRCQSDCLNTLFIGDQTFTDILGANKAGIHSIMVKPILKWREPIQIIIKRIPEAIVMFLYKLQKLH